ncbi:MAG: fatty acid desaturase [Polyangiaceae bacterium]|nr:fatty acid desaturase [Myxococcales bacterium]MCB9588975.1 fatty acid desaturase [Polyangiaceae bacterium]MCB9610349.1 fatty acid desaturase [Polyangiaceae bacterium]
MKSLDAKLVQLIQDPRDLPFLHLMLQCAVVACCGIGLFFAKDYFWYLVPVYWVLWFAWVVDRFILMLHCTSHRMLFKKQYRALNYVIPWLLGPFFGETPESYFVHHMGMHHPENNLEHDTSSTMRFKRDRFTHWLRYYLRFMFLGLYDLAAYHLEKGNKKMIRRLVVGETTFWLVIGGLAYLNWQATFVVFVLPVIIVRTLMMMGNWTQHAFIDPASPEVAYRNSITCINTRYNRRCFNDGYHIHHHVKARCHFADYPAEFEDNKEVYGREDAVVFDGVDYFQVWLMLMVGAWKGLAKRVVQLPGAPERDEAATIAWLKSRVEPITASELALDGASPAE